MIYLTVEQVLFIHKRVIDETGGGRGIRDLGLLEAAVARPRATFGGTDLYPNLILKATALLDSLVRNHPFVDGNKCVGITAAGIFLVRNGQRIIASNEDLEQFVFQVARSELSLEAMADWLHENTAPVFDPLDSA